MEERLFLPSASKWRRLELCQGSHALELEAERLGQVAHQDSADAKAGTGIHAAVDLLQQGKEPPKELPEKDLQSAKLLSERSQEQIERIFHPTRQPIVMRERRLWMYLDKKPVLSGRFDLVAYNQEQTLALIQDFKTGWSEPDAAEDNSQMMILALLVGLNMPTLEEVIVQLVSGPYGITEARYTMNQLGMVYDSVVKLLRVIHSPDAPLHPSPEACKFCTAKLICQAFKDQVVTPMVGLRSSPLPVEPAEAAKILDQVEMLTKFLKEVKAFYAKKLEDPKYSIPGWEMVPGNILREVTDWDAARNRLSEYLPIEQLKSAADYRLGELETALGKVLNLKDKALRDRMNEILKGLYVEKQNASSLKPNKKKKAKAS